MSYGSARVFDVRTVRMIKKNEFVHLFYFEQVNDFLWFHTDKFVLATYSSSSLEIKISNVIGVDALANF